MEREPATNLSQFGHLSGKGSARGLPQLGKPGWIVLAEVSKDTFCIDPHKFAHHLNGKHFTIPQDGLWTALVWAPSNENSIDQAIHCSHERYIVDCGDLLYLLFVSQLYKHGGLLFLSSPDDLHIGLIDF